MCAGSQEDNDDWQEEACGLHIVQHLLQAAVSSLDHVSHHIVDQLLASGGS